MALGTLISKLKAKKQATERTAFGHYLETVKALAAGTEADADEVACILDVASKTETDLLRDVQTQTQRLAWHSQMMANQQAVADRRQAENELATAQAELQKAYDRLTPAIQAAQSRLKTLDQIALTTSQAESRLSELVLDNELLEREAGIITELREINDELKPLQIDRGHKANGLANAEYNLSKLQGRPDDAWPGGFLSNPLFWRDKETTPAQQRVDDLKNQIQQLDQAIAPRQAKQRALQNELNQIHAKKLEP